ncbi:MULTISPECIES: DNA recombination protein RmuC [Pseudarthrobacter]|uniref:DNA recombination protein RmuC n=1 Tax=Pseudarthrobacter niigatensis TaxID=369935 RepID=A0AAJ1SQ66_9MICC|nr:MULTISPECIES: DNA recombination protein RmuC [Pseudarthrobacter]MDQ0144819.1 DNA recombination protein RmuC [Pseudarthrobacter niigatensis]MDQ0264256.1 DNA recombination protein RmuC [Pseudarthrobacter niigatensis]QDG62890.1 DNA recombination protein RmuC [Pseudarthrobacter sp. NIBRBAC000502771]QDG89011.1 DNA recombination protein RmuC [Pseudarthrobacter sp. NIBRBAC000502770]
MDAFALILALFMLLLGALAGAAATYFSLRRNSHALEADFDQVSSRLSEVTAQLAAADAERRLLAAQNRELGEARTQDGSVLRALAPVAEKLSAVQQQVALLERDRVEQYGQLAQQLQEARLSDEQLIRSTHALESALRSNSARGQWGEVQLRRVVEAAGMLRHVDFVEQVHSAGHDSAVRPDLVVQLPGDKQLVVDAKVPLSSYLEAQELGSVDPRLGPAGPQSANDGRNRQALLAAHAKALRAHVDALGTKKYWDIPGNSPELVVCFIPAESILAAALTADAGLLDHALSRNVVLASPSTLLAVLKSVAFTWRQDVLTDSARELFELARQLYDRMGTLGENVTKLGSSLKTSVDRYNAMVGTLEARVLPTARKLNSLEETGLVAPPLVEVQPRALVAPELQGDGEAA